VIIAWVLSVLVLFSSLIVYLERMTALEIISIHTLLESQKEFMNAEKALFECEQYLSDISALENNHCYIQSMGKNLWLLSTKQKPQLEVLVTLDGDSGIATRLNWRQVFE